VQAIAVVDRAAVKQTESWPMVTAGEISRWRSMQLPDMCFGLPQPCHPRRIRGEGRLADRERRHLRRCGRRVSDAKRRRHVSCGEGFLDVLAADGRNTSGLRIPTVPGARTSLWCRN
jgi:hypothetical protein